MEKWITNAIGKQINAMLEKV